MLAYLWVIKHFWSTRERNTHKFKALYWAVYYRQWISALRRQFRKHNLVYVFSLHPYLLFMCRLKAYVLKQVSSEFIGERLIGHYRLLDWFFGRQGVEAIHADGLLLGKSYVAEKEVEVWLQYIHLMRYEGQLSVKLVFDGEILYLAHVHFCDAAMWIGGLQGRPAQLDASKDFTKQSNGLRPHNFMYFILTLLAERLQVNAIYAVASEHHYYQKEEKTRHKIRFNYNEFWAELGGEPSAIEGWFKMPVFYPRKTLSAIPAKKRSQYTQRYQLMDQIKQDVLGVGLSVKAA